MYINTCVFVKMALECNPYLDIKSSDWRRYPCDLALINFLTIYRDFFGRIDADTDLGAVHGDDDHGNVARDAQGFAGASCEYQQRISP